MNTGETARKAAHASEKIGEWDELINARIESLSAILARPHSMEELEADIKALNEIIELFKTDKNLLRKLNDVDIPEEERAGIGRRLERQRELIKPHNRDPRSLLNKSHELIKESVTLTTKMHQQISALSDPPPFNPQNRILAKLPDCERESLLEKSDAVSLSFGEALYRADQEVEYIYFPETAVISLLSVMEDGSTVAIGLVGSEGMVGIRALSSAIAIPYQAVVQMAGTALRVKAGALGEEATRGGSFQALLLSYIQAVLIQLRQLAACNQLHSIEQKLIRWLLTMQDHTRSDRLLLTQELLASLIGARRAGISTAAASLQEAGIIRYRRGVITILDRGAMERAACECYAVLKQAYDRLTA